LTLILFLLSVLFFVAGKIEIVTIDKDINQIEINKSNLFICMKESKKRDLKDIFAVNLYKKGHYGSMHSTLVYSLKIEFRNDKPLNLLMSRSISKIRKQVSLFHLLANKFRLFRLRISWATSARKKIFRLSTKRLMD